MRTAIATDAAVKSRVRLLKVLLMLWFLQAALGGFAQPVTLITPTNTTWRYLADGSDEGTAWQTAAFDDSAWPEGRGLFGNENNYPYPINTLIPGLTPITVYYRTHFIWVGGVFGITLTGTNYVDDGSIIYLNGVEIARFNMPDGQADFLTLAPVANPGGEPVMVQVRVPLDSLTNGNANPLINGDNVIAVEVHQNSSTSSDRVFGLSLYGGYHNFPCVSDGISPTNRTIFEGRSTTFIVVLDSHCFPRPDLQWYRNVGFGEELIFGATSNSYTLTNAMNLIDAGVYYCRLTSPGGTVDSRQAVLTILPDPLAGQRIELISVTNHIWRFLGDGSDQGTAWRLPDFDDNAWPQGRGLFGRELSNVYPYEFATPFPGLGLLTCYFRTQFSWSYGSPVGVVLTGTNHVDDGCVVYLNGVEITRFNMPQGTPAFDTLALSANPGGYPNLSQGEPVRVLMQIPLDYLTNGHANPLRNGDNVLAVEVHNDATMSDLVFGLSLYGQQARPPCLDGAQPTNRLVLAGRSTTFTVVEQCAIPPASIQWYRNVGAGEEIIWGATGASFTLTNAIENVDDGVYYARLTNRSGSVDSRQAVLVVEHDDVFPQFLSASVVVAGLNTFRLTTDEELCGDEIACGSDYTNPFNWQILQSDNTSIDLEVGTVVQINPTLYEFTTSLPRDPAKQYQITVNPAWGEISDAFGNFVPPGTFAETPFTLTFQQGNANGYTGTQDAEIHSNATADTPLGTATQMKCDLDDSGIAQGLLSFDNIIGFSPYQIPPGSRIRSATLTLNQADPGATVNLHRLLVSWDQTTTWNSLMNGVIADDVEARAVADATTPEMLANGPVELEITTSVQAWADGQPNHGWALLSTGIDGWIVNTSESGASTAPLLTVEFEHVEECIPVIVGQPPPTLAVFEGRPFSISVGVSNPFGLVFQWTRNGVDIPGATGSSYSVQSAGLMDSGAYRLRISCESDPATSIISSPSVVTLVGDDTRVYLTGAAAKLDGTTVMLQFSKPLNEASARNPANYVFTPALAVTDATLNNRTSSATVTLTTTPREVAANYVLRIANLIDTRSAGNLIDPNPTFITLTSASVILPWDADGWLYNTNNLDATPDWKNPDFTPGPDWRTGRGLFGTEVRLDPLIPWLEFIATPLIPNNVLAESELRVTAYFRKTIDLPALPAGAHYIICHYADDGFIAYLDGAEIHRFAMPDGAVTFTNRSTGIPTGDATHRSFTFNATPGIHTLAVELHQAGVISSDVLFGVEVRMVAGTSPSLSIAQSVNGDVNLNWNADNNWRLRSALAVSGPYLDVAIPVGSRLGTFTLPSTSVTNRSFWLLDYISGP